MATTTTSSSNLRSLIYEVTADGKPSLQVLDQLLLPAEKVYVNVSNIQTTWSVIQKMQIRGTFVQKGVSYVMDDGRSVALSSKE